MLVCLLVLTITFFLLTLYSIAQANMDVWHIEASRWMTLKILDTSSAATLFVTVLGALLVRHQFALGVLPRINYKAAKTEKQNKRTTTGAFETWRVEIRNTGLGSAIVTQAEYFIEIPGSKTDPYPSTFDELISDLALMGLIRDRDFWIEKIASGFSLSPKDECFVFEIKLEQVTKIKGLHMALYFQGQLGDRYRREIFLVPRN